MTRTEYQLRRITAAERDLYHARRRLADAYATPRPKWYNLAGRARRRRAVLDAFADMRRAEERVRMVSQ